MFGISFSNVIIILLVIIIFIRPNDLPKFLREAGKFYGKAKKMYNEIIQVKDHIMKEIDEAAAIDESAQHESKEDPRLTVPPQE